MMSINLPFHLASVVLASLVIDLYRVILIQQLSCHWLAVEPLHVKAMKAIKAPMIRMTH